jgi:glutamate/tyrosine decarboxylase-like PLP-dependent enzyme
MTNSTPGSPALPPSSHPAPEPPDAPPPWAALARELDPLFDDIRDLPVLPPAGTGPDEVRRALAGFDFEEPVPLDRLIADLAGLLREHTVQVTHPRYFGLFNPSVRRAGIAGDALAAGFNLQLAAWSHAPAAAELERLTLRALARPLGFDPDAMLAHFASGGAEANLSAVLVALAHAFPESGRLGVGGLGVRPAIYVGGESHHSFMKIARMAGLGTEALREAKVTGHWTLDVADLASRIQADRAAGWMPLLIVGTAGTTSAGVVDDLPALGGLARANDAWFHVDAAWGGAAALSPRLRPALSGIERADSVTWDAHKWLSAPMGAGMFFCRHPAAVRRAFATTTAYMPAGADGADDPYQVTPQWSRRAIGLKVFCTLAELGMDGMRAQVEHQARMGDRMKELLREAGWEVVNDTQLPLACVTHPDARAGRVDLAALVAKVHARRKVWVSRTVLAGKLPVIRACITSWRTTPADLEVLVAELEAARAECLAG